MKLNVVINDSKNCKNIVGTNSENIKALEEIFSSSIEVHGDSVLTDLEDELKIVKLESIFNILNEMSIKGFSITLRDIYYIVSIVDEGK